MISSSSSELQLWQRGRLVANIAAPEVDPVREEAAAEELTDGRGVEVAVLRPTAGTTWGRVRLGIDVLLVLQPGVAEIRTAVPGLDEEYGEATFIYEEFDAADPENATVLLSLHVGLHADPAIEDLYERLVGELEAVHAGLARDVLSRTSHRAALGRRAPPVVTVEDMLRRLHALRESLAVALNRIGVQPSVALDRRVERGRWRPRDVVPAARLGDLVREPGIVLEDGAVRAITTARLLRTHTTTDIAEHRHLREGPSRLRDRAALLARHCRLAVRSYESECRRWGRAQEDGSSVFERRYLPRIRALQVWDREAAEIGVAFTSMLDGSPFLQGAGPIRGPLVPTPLFLNRPGYQQAYAALRDAAELGDCLPLGEALRVRYRSLSTLYEYWCFVKTVELLREREDLGTPEPREVFAVIDGLYRPELEPGQAFRFPRTGGGFVTVTYEPEFPPLGYTQSGATFRASLGTGTLRPDITVAVERRDDPPVMLVLDAKSVSHFREVRLWEVSDYRSRVCDPQTGHQPVRQVFLLHRDASPSASLVNVPGYLEGRTGSVASSILGAVAFLPDRMTTLRRVLERFLTLYR